MQGKIYIWRELKSERENIWSSIQPKLCWRETSRRHCRGSATTVHSLWQSPGESVNPCRADRVPPAVVIVSRWQKEKEKQGDSQWWNAMQLWAVPIWAVTFWTLQSRWRDADDLEGSSRYACLFINYKSKPQALNSLWNISLLKQQTPQSSNWSLWILSRITNCDS